MALTSSQTKQVRLLALKGLGLFLVCSLILASFIGFFEDNIEKKHWVTLVISTVGLGCLLFEIWRGILRGLKNEK